MNEAALLFTALLFGGTTLFAFGFAGFMFNVLPADTAGTVIRRAFPWFYLFVLGSSLLVALLAIGGDMASVVILALIAGTTVIARQILMPAINRATDAGNKRLFQVLHSTSVLLTLAHIVAAGVVLIRLAN